MVSWGSWAEPKTDLRIIIFKKEKENSLRLECPDASGPGLLRASPSGEERCTPHHTVPVSPQWPQEVSLLTLPVFQGAAISSVHFSQSLPPRNVAELGGSPPLRGSLDLTSGKCVSPVQRTSYLGVVWDPTMMQARMSPARIESILTSVKRVREGRSLTVKQFQKLLGLMSAASNVIPFDLLYMRPLEWWLKTKGFSPRGKPTSHD